MRTRQDAEHSMSLIDNQSGVALVMSLLTMTLLTLLGGAAVTTSNLEQLVSANYKTTGKVRNLTVAGFEHGKSVLKTSDLNALLDGTLEGDRGELPLTACATNSSCTIAAGTYTLTVVDNDEDVGSSGADDDCFSAQADALCVADTDNAVIMQVTATDATTAGTSTVRAGLQKVIAPIPTLSGAMSMIGEGDTGLGICNVACGCNTCGCGTTCPTPGGACVAACYQIDGRDWIADGTALANPGSPMTGALAGIGMSNLNTPADQALMEAQLAASGSDNVIGLQNVGGTAGIETDGSGINGTPTPGSGLFTNSVAADSSLNTTDLSNFINLAMANPDLTYDGLAATSFLLPDGSPNVSGTWGTPGGGEQVVVLENNGAFLPGNVGGAGITGAGVLIVKGRFNNFANLNWSGIIISVDDTNNGVTGGVYLDQASFMGSANVTGGIVVDGQIDGAEQEAKLANNTTVRYSSQANANAAAAVFRTGAGQLVTQWWKQCEGAC